MVVVENSGKSEEEYIIDGQQRITTVSLLFLAIYQKLNAKSELNSILFIDDTDEPKLKLNLDDSKAYQRLFNTNELNINGSKITENLNTQELSDLLNALDYLKIMLVNIGYSEDPQKIFESLNSTGVDLTEGDKIRNFILMNERIDEQQTCFKNYWRPIEQNVEG